MSGVAIYLEGGGDGKESKAELRQGMDAFLTSLKEAARAKSLRWKVVPCGGRNQAFDAFRHAHKVGEMSITALLVDAEGPVTGSPRAYLAARDGWDLSDVDDDMIHLMIQTMETWVISDINALAAYYGPHFHRNALPSTKNLETVEKVTVAKKLEQATRQTQKGTYHKIHHARDLLAQINEGIVRQRCPGCNRLFTKMAAAIAQR